MIWTRKIRNNHSTYSQRTCNIAKGSHGPEAQGEGFAKYFIILLNLKCGKSTFFSNGEFMPHLWKHWKRLFTVLSSRSRILVSDFGGWIIWRKPMPNFIKHYVSNGIRFMFVCYVLKLHRAVQILHVLSDRLSDHPVLRNIFGECIFLMLLTKTSNLHIIVLLWRESSVLLPSLRVSNAESVKSPCLLTWISSPTGNFRPSGKSAHSSVVSSIVHRVIALETEQNLGREVTLITHKRRPLVHLYGQSLAFLLWVFKHANYQLTWRLVVTGRDVSRRINLGWTFCCRSQI